MKLQLLVVLFLLSLLLLACNESSNKDHCATTPGMVKVTILYPNGKGKTFNMDYYAQNHMPMVAEVLGNALTCFEIDQGVAGRTPNDTVPYLAIGYLYFTSLEAYQEAFAPNAAQITGDIPNYTNTVPTIQISEIIK